ncbi:HNH endonuclease [Corynebacterium uropygiale]|uniref:HNH endonuclease n=1 Tax=Corynebacterium uropygiale TaxID=1775911 RepID=UPI0030843FF4
MTTAEGRELVVDLLTSGLPVSAAAAKDALLGGDAAVAEFLSSGAKDDALNADVRELLSVLGQVSGAQTNEEIRRLTSEGSTEDMIAFLDGGYQEFQAKDDLKTAWLSTQAPEGSVEKKRAEDAVRDGSREAIEKFATTGLTEARAHDQRMTVWKLMQSAPQTVKDAASAALRDNDPEAIEEFLRFGYPVAVLQASDEATMGELVEEAQTQSQLAAEGASMAVQHAESARAALEAARIATERARDEALRADAAEKRGAAAAEQAGRLASRVALLADSAASAAAEARSALAMTLAALARAQQAATRAQQAAAAASHHAMAAGNDASLAAQARQAAEAARNAQDAARGAAYNFELADRALHAAQSAGSAAGSAAAHADAAAGAAADAAGAAGIAEDAAAQARAGAAQARAAAGRARAASGEIDSIVPRIAELVERTKKAAKEAEEHAGRSAEAAAEAERQAGNAQWFADQAGRFATQAEDAAARLDELVSLGEETVQLSRQMYEDLVSDEREVRVGKAKALRHVQDVHDQTQREREEHEKAALRDLEWMSAESVRADDERVLPAIVNAAQYGEPSVAEHAAVVLAGGKAEDIQAFLDEGAEDALYQRSMTTLAGLMENDPLDTVRAEAEQMWYQDGDAVDQFLTVRVPELKLGDLRRRAYDARESGGAEVRKRVDEALVDGSYEALHRLFDEGGYADAMHRDQLEFAYQQLQQGGPVMKMMAEEAIQGDRRGLERFYRVGQFEANYHDGVRATHEQAMDAAVERMRLQAAQAHEDATLARKAHEDAQGSAEAAAALAAEAHRFAGLAQQSAEKARGHVTSAENSYHVALQEQQRARQAADAAEADARQAAVHADKSESLAAIARQSAGAAAQSAAEARSYAIQAESDAQQAGVIAQGAYVFAQNVEIEERQQAVLAGLEEGEEPTQVSLLDLIKEEVGPAAFDLLLEIVGINDIRRCVQGEWGSCAMLAASVIPVGKLASLAMKSGKIARAVAKLTTSASRIMRRFKELKEARVVQKFAKHGTICGITPAGQQRGVELHVVPGVLQRQARPEWNTGFNARLAARTCVPDTVLRTRRGYSPINGKLAGMTIKKDIVLKDGEISEVVVPYTERGFPDFSASRYKEGGFSRNIVRIEPKMTRWGDNKSADAAAGIDKNFRKVNDLVWHHTEEEGVMMLLPRKVHNEFRHTGGFYFWGGKYKALPKPLREKHRVDCPINQAGSILGDWVRDNPPEMSRLNWCKSWS